MFNYCNISDDRLFHTWYKINGHKGKIDGDYQFELNIYSFLIQEEEWDDFFDQF